MPPTRALLVVLLLVARTRPAFACEVDDECAACRSCVSVCQTPQCAGIAAKPNCDCRKKVCYPRSVLCDDDKVCTHDSCVPKVAVLPPPPCSPSPEPPCVCAHVKTDPACVEPCMQASDCDDLDPCTIDTCPNHGCSNVPIQNCCTSDAQCAVINKPCVSMAKCLPARPGVRLTDGGGRCELTKLPNGASCDDDDKCNGVETCNSEGECIPGKPPACSCKR